MSRPATRTEALLYPEGPESWARRALLSPLTLASWGFELGARVRGTLYDEGVLTARQVDGLRVVSVGNLNVGGTGKTPVVLHLAGLLLAAGRRVAVLSRGYGRSAPDARVFRGRDGLPPAFEVGDEPRLVAARAPDVHVLVGPDRARLAVRARDELRCDVALLDDGFQHRRLWRDEDLVVVDEAVGFGNGRVLPRGPLREPLSALSRATLLWVKAAPGAAAPLPLPPGVPVVRARHAAGAWTAPDGQVVPGAALAGAPALALAGLARPGGFLATLEGLGVRVDERALFPDHHAYTAEELERVRARAEARGLRVVTTEKDAMRLPPGFPAWVLCLEVEVLEGASHLRAALGLP